MDIGILLSCMNQVDNGIIARSNLSNVKTFVINQCNCEYEKIITYNDNCQILNTPTRGLSMSRNLGIQFSNFDICVLSDDDEVFVDDVEKIVAGAYSQYDADVIIFKIQNLVKKLGEKPRKLKWKDCLRVSSQQITFRREKVEKAKIKFDTLLGAGTGNGAAEENKFLLECRKAKLKIWFVPMEIAVLNTERISTWFNGFDETYFYNLGKSLRYILGLFISSIYAVYTMISKRKLFSDIPKKRAIKYFFKGIIKNDIGEYKRKQKK